MASSRASEGRRNVQKRLRQGGHRIACEFVRRRPDRPCLAEGIIGVPRDEGSVAVGQPVDRAQTVVEVVVVPERCSPREEPASRVADEVARNAPSGLGQQPQGALRVEVRSGAHALGLALTPVEKGGVTVRRRCGERLIRGAVGEAAPAAAHEVAALVVDVGCAVDIHQFVCGVVAVHRVLGHAPRLSTPRTAEAKWPTCARTGETTATRTQTVAIGTNTRIAIGRFRHPDRRAPA
jgi:hypothetical protein